MIGAYQCLAYERARKTVREDIGKEIERLGSMTKDWTKKDA
jgi:hypothetical protein